MTDEEMAEEYASSSTSDRGYYYEGLKEGFLAGLKAGRPEWHKVANGELPKDSRLVLIQMVNGNTTMGIYYVNAWREICNCKELTGVIAWCEIPKYTEE